MVCLSPRVVNQMIPGCVVAATEAFAVVCAGAFGNMRVAILITIVDIRPAVVVIVFTGTLDAIVISLPLNVAKFRRWLVPVPVPVPVAVMILVLGRRSCGKWVSHRE